MTLINIKLRKTKLQIDCIQRYHVKTKKIMQTHMLHGEWESCVGVMSPGFRMVVPTWEERGT